MRLLGEIFLPSRNQVTWGWGKLAMRGARMTAASPWDTLCCASLSSKLPMSAGQRGQQHGDEAGSGPRAGWRPRGWGPKRVGRICGVCSSLPSPRAAPTCPGLSSSQEPSPQTPQQLIPITQKRMGTARWDQAPGLPGDPPEQGEPGHDLGSAARLGCPRPQIYTSEKSEAGCVEKGEGGGIFIDFP